MRVNIPTMLTWARIAVIPLLVSLVYLPEGWIGSRSAQYLATALFIAAGITDWLDGYLARRLNQTSAFGAWLDPVSDKLLICASLILLVHLSRVHSSIAIVIIGREIAVSALREWMAQLGESKSVAVAFIGKLKTAAQMVAIPLLLADLHGDWPIGSKEVGTVLIWAAAALTLWSLGYYVKATAAVMSAREARAKAGSKTGTRGAAVV